MIEKIKETLEDNKHDMDIAIGHPSCIISKPGIRSSSANAEGDNGGVFAPHFSGKNFQSSSLRHQPSFPPLSTPHAASPANSLVFRCFDVFDVYHADHNLYSAASDWWDTLGVHRSLPIKPMDRSAFPSDCICLHLHRTTFEPPSCTSCPALIPLPRPSCPFFHPSSLSIGFCTTSIIPQP